MRQVGDHVGGAQELAPGARKRVGGRIRGAPLRDDVVVGHVLQAVAGRDEVGLRRIARPALPVHRVEQAVSRELRMEDKPDEPAAQSVVDRMRERLRHVRVHVRLIVRIDPVQETARVVGEAAAVGKVPHVVDARPAGRIHVLIGGAYPAGVGQARQFHDLNRNSALHNAFWNRVARDRLGGGVHNLNRKKRDDADPHSGSHENLPRCHGRWRQPLLKERGLGTPQQPGCEATRFPMEAKEGCRLLALLGPREMSDLSPQSGPQRTLSRHRRMTGFDPKPS
jgi:hypothetical protein